MNEEKPNLINITDANDIKPSTNEQLEYQLSSGKNDTPEHAKKRKKIIIIVSIVVVLLAIITFVTIKVLSNNESRFNGYTAELGETLKVREITTNLEIKVVDSLKKETIKEALSTDEYLKLKIKVNNKDNSEMALSVLIFSLTDQSKKVIANRHITLNNVTDDIGDSHILKNRDVEGYIYFTDKDSKDTTDHKISDTTISNAKYLKVQVMSQAEDLGNGKYNIKYEDYYLPIK